MKEQDYWVTIPKNQIELARVNPRTEINEVGSGNVQFWWGYGYGENLPDYTFRELTVNEDKNLIRARLEKLGVSVIDIDTSPKESNQSK